MNIPEIQSKDFVLSKPEPRAQHCSKACDLKEKKTKTAFVIEAIDEKLGLVRNRESALRNFAGWLTNKEAEELRHATKIFETIEEGDWK